MRTVVYCTLILTLSLSCIACSQMTEPESYLGVSNTTIPIDHALRSMEKLIDLKVIPTRTGTANQYSVSVVGGKDFGIETKSANDNSIPDTLLYIVNFGGEQGFSILSGDTRIKTSVYCLTEKGSISSEDFINAYHFMHDTNQEATYNLESVFVPSLILASVLPDIRGDGGEGGDDDEDHDDLLTTMMKEWDGELHVGLGYIKVGPYVKTKWGQSIEPLNSLLNNGLVGCVAIAIGQIIVANKYSNTLVFDGVTCNLDTLETVRHYSHPDSLSTPFSANACNQAAHFITFLRSSDLLNMTDNGATDEDAANAFEYLGYDNVEIIGNNYSFTPFMSGKVIDMVNNHYPIYVAGTDQTSGGHAWVVDGYFYTSGLLLFHVNWGWNGYRDGYYDYGIFDSGRSHYADIAVDGNNSFYGPEYNFSYNFAMIEYTL